MAAQIQNPGWQAGASLDQIGSGLHSSLTASGWQAQILASRFCLSPWMARELARLCFGEDRDD